MRRSRAGLLLLLCLTAGMAGAQGVTLKPLSAAEVRTVNAGLDMGLLPNGAGAAQVVGRQSFRVLVGGRAEVTLVPVRFSIAAAGLVKGIPRETNECGVFLVDRAGKGRFETLPEAGLVQCGGVEAVGLARGGGAHAQVIVIFAGYTVRRSWSDPYLVSWSENDGRYVVEALAAPAWAGAGERLTIAEARRWVDGR